MKFGKIFSALVVVALACCGLARAQDGDAVARQNERQARAALDAMIQALGPVWMNMESRVYEGRTSAFYHGNPTGGIIDYTEVHRFPAQDRIEYGKKHDVVQIFSGNQGWEITFRGKKDLPRDHVEEYIRRRDHSIETAVKVWLKDPKTILLYEGKSLVERHLTEQVTLFSATNDAITLQMDAQTHLPLRRSFKWRDPLYKDKNEDAEEYSDYHVVDGVPTPFTITRSVNGDMVNQRFLYRASYNRPVPPEAFDADQTALKIKK